MDPCIFKCMRLSNRYIHVLYACICLLCASVLPGNMYILSVSIYYLMYTWYDCVYTPRRSCACMVAHGVCLIRFRVYMFVVGVYTYYGC